MTFHLPYYMVGFELNENSHIMKVIDQPKVGQLIREIRLLTGLTQEQFAAKVGVTYSTINRWENSRSKPLPIAIRQIETILLDMGDRGQELLAKYNSN